MRRIWLLRVLGRRSRALNDANGSPDSGTQAAQEKEITADAAGVMLGPREGEKIVGGGIDATLKVPKSHPASTCSFEVRVPPGYDVGAHVHTEGEEVFYVISGTLDVLAFEPIDRDIKDWHAWKSADGKTYIRGRPGSFLYVPPNVPHAFGNPTDEETVMFFQSSAPGGHDNYFKELSKLLVDSHGKPPESDMVALREKYDIIQLTQLHPGLEAQGA